MRSKTPAPPPPEAAPAPPPDERLAIARHMRGLAERLNKDSLWLRGPIRATKDNRLEMAAKVMRSLAEDLFDVGHEMAGGGLALAEAATERPTPLLDAIAPKPPPGAARKAKAPKEAEGPEDRTGTGAPMMFGIERDDGTPICKVWAHYQTEAVRVFDRSPGAAGRQFGIRAVDLSEPEAAARFAGVDWLTNGEIANREGSNGRDGAEVGGADAAPADRGVRARRPRRAVRPARPADHGEAADLGGGAGQAQAEELPGPGSVGGEGPAGGEGGRPGGGDGGGAAVVVGTVAVTGDGLTDAQAAIADAWSRD